MSGIPVHIYFVLDRSGSMQAIKDDVIGGFNAFLEDQKSEEGECRLTMIQFDSQAPNEVLYDAVEIQAARPLTANSFVPRGATPLLDAEGSMISRARRRETEREAAGEAGEAVLFVTFTDGLENASQEWSYKALTNAKREAEERGWAFSYLGCGHDAYGQSSRIGTNQASTRSFGASEVPAAMALMSGASARYRRRAGRGEYTDSARLFDKDEE